MLPHPLIVEEIVRERLERLRDEAARDHRAAALRRRRASPVHAESARGSLRSALRSAVARLAPSRVRSPTP